MKIRTLPCTALALLLFIAVGEARSRRGSGDDGGPLSRDRGLAAGESAAVGVVLRGVTGAQAEAPATPPSRRYSPDYYRAYPQRPHAAGPARKVAVAPQPAKPTPTPAPRVAARKTAPVAAPKVAPTPKPVAKAKMTPLRVAVLPRGMDRSRAVAARVAVKPKPTPVPKVTPLRVAVLPRRVATPPRPVAKPRRVITQPAGAEPMRVLFRN